MRANWATQGKIRASFALYLLLHEKCGFSIEKSIENTCFRQVSDQFSSIKFLNCEWEPTELPARREFPLAKFLSDFCWNFSTVTSVKNPPSEIFHQSKSLTMVYVYPLAEETPSKICTDLKNNLKSYAYILIFTSIKKTK